MITSFSGQHSFLSNFAAAPVMLDGEQYPTVEHAYQAAKTINLLDRQRIQKCQTAGEAKRLGRALAMRADWDSVKLDVMRRLLEQKFAPGTMYAGRLKNTGSEILVEGNTWGDTFWGRVMKDGGWQGRNNLGRLLMEIRSQLLIGCIYTRHRSEV